MDKRQSGQLADEYVRNFTQARAVSRPRERSRRCTQRVLPGISLAEVNGLAREWMPEGNRVVMVSAPQKPGVDGAGRGDAGGRDQGRGEQAAHSRTRTRRRRSRCSRRDARAPGPSPRPTSRADVGITEWKLSNGVKVVLKPTTFKEDEIVFRAFSPGGTSLVSDDDLIWAEPRRAVIASRRPRRVQRDRAAQDADGQDRRRQRRTSASSTRA